MKFPNDNQVEMSDYFLSHPMMDIHTKERYGGALASRTTITNGSTRRTSNYRWSYMSGK